MVVIEMPKFGLIMEEGTIGEWYVSEGDHVDAGQAICSVETQKLANDVEAPVSGVITRIIAQEGDVIPIQEPIAEMDQD